MTKSARIIRITNWANTKETRPIRENAANTGKVGQYENDVIQRSITLEKKHSGHFLNRNKK